MRPGPRVPSRRLRPAGVGADKAAPQRAADDRGPQVLGRLGSEQGPGRSGRGSSRQPRGPVRRGPSLNTINARAGNEFACDCKTLTRETIARRWTFFPSCSDLLDAHLVLAASFIVQGQTSVILESVLGLDELYDSRDVRQSLRPGPSKDLHRGLDALERPLGGHMAQTSCGPRMGEFFRHVHQRSHGRV